MRIRHHDYGNNPGRILLIVVARLLLQLCGAINSLFFVGKSKAGKGSVCAGTKARILLEKAGGMVNVKESVIGGWVCFAG